MLGCNLIVVLEAPRLVSGWIVFGYASFRVLTGLCSVIVQFQYWKCLVWGPGWIMLDYSLTLVLEMPRLGSWLDGAWLQYNFSSGDNPFGGQAGLCLVVVQLQYCKCLVWGPGWIVFGCSIILVSEKPRLGSGWIVFGCSTIFVL